MKWKKTLKKASIRVPWYDDSKGGWIARSTPEGDFIFDASTNRAVKQELNVSTIDNMLGRGFDKETKIYPHKILGNNIYADGGIDARGAPQYLRMDNFPIDINEFNELLRKAKEMVQAKFVGSQGPLGDYNRLWVYIWKTPQDYDAMKNRINSDWQEYQQSQQGLRGKLRARKYRRNISG